MKVCKEAENEVPHRAALPDAGLCLSRALCKKILKLSTVLEIAVLPAAYGSPETEAPCTFPQESPCLLEWHFSQLQTTPGLKAKLVPYRVFKNGARLKKDRVSLRFL